MKRNIRRISILLLLLLTINLVTPLMAKNVKVLPGIAVDLELGQTISAKTAQIGDRISFKVVKDILIDDEVVISANTMALGEVIDVSKPGALGKPGSLGISIKHTQAVDGTQIPLTASRIVRGDNKQTEAILVTLILCIFGLFITGGDASLQAGSVIETTVSSVVTIEVEDQEVIIEEDLPDEVIEETLEDMNEDSIEEVEEELIEEDTETPTE